MRAPYQPGYGPHSRENIMKKFRGSYIARCAIVSMLLTSAACEDAYENPQGNDVVIVDGTPGEDGIHCWDTDEDGHNDPSEDTNGDRLFDSEDCQGDDGTPGEDGIHCWDTDEDGHNDPSEDTNGDRLFDSEDCQGDDGEDSPTCTFADLDCDLDGDGVNNGEDCDPNDPEDAVWFTVYTDTDGDGDGNPEEEFRVCGLEPGLSTNNDDLCPDDADLTDPLTWYQDLDNDDYGDDDITIDACVAPANFAELSGDNCPNLANPTQSDVNSNGIGDACEPVVTPPTRNFTFSCVVPTGLPTTTRCEVHVYYGNSLGDQAEYDFTSLTLSEGAVCGSTWQPVPFEVNVRLSGPGYASMPWVGGQYARVTDPNGNSIALSVIDHPWADPDNFRPTGNRIPYCE